MTYDYGFNNWNNGQTVNQTDMNTNSSDVYQRLTVVDYPIPFITSGLQVTNISGSGLATVSAGTCVDIPFSQSDNPDLPQDNLQAIGYMPSSLTVQITASVAEFGFIVLRQTTTPLVPAQRLYTIVSTLVYISGTSTAYPAVQPHDVVLAGIVVTGTTPSLVYTLDLSPRDIDMISYQQSLSGVQYNNNAQFEQWDSGTGPITIPPDTETLTANFWYVKSDGAEDLTAQRAALSSGERALVNNSPVYALEVQRTVAEGSGGATDLIYQSLNPYYLLNNRYVTYSVWLKNTSAAAVTGNFYTVFDNGNGSQGAVASPAQPFSVPNDSVYHLYTFTFWLSPNLGGGTVNSAANFIYPILGITSTEAIYTLFITEDNCALGSFYIPSSRQEFGTMARQNADAVKITGGSINGTDIGDEVPGGGVFSQAYDNGGTPTASNQLTNLDYVDQQIATATEVKAMLTGNTNGTSPTIAYSKNIATFTHLSTGVYGITFTTPLISAEYVPLLTLGYNSITSALNYRLTIIDASKTVNGFEFEIQDASDALVDNALPTYLAVFYG